jgi:hypothetical protein
MGVTTKSGLFAIACPVILTVALDDPSCAQSASQSGSPTIPTATNDVKAGDWIIWLAKSKPPPLTEVTSTSSHTNAPTQTPTTADIAAAANAVQTAAKTAIVPTAVAAYSANATQADKDKLKAALDASKQADDDAQKANAANSNPNIGSSTALAAQDLIATANASVANALKDEKTAGDQALADQTALANAKTPSQELKDKATASSKKVDQKRAATAQALAYLDAAIAAQKKVVASAASASPAAFCAPPGSRFLVTNISGGDSTSASSQAAPQKAVSPGGGSDSTGTSSKNSTNSSTGTASSTSTVQGYYPSAFLFFHFQAIKEYPPPRIKNGSLTPPESVTRPTLCKSGEPLPSYDTLYQFQATSDSKAAYYREGFTWGGMVIPYKFYVKDKTFKGNPSTVGFVGYEGWFPAMSLAGIVALGPGIAQSSSMTSATATPSTKPSSTSSAVTYTAATGVVATFGGSIKAGLLVGWDWQGSGNNFQYEGKTWVALSIGASF